MRIAIGFSTGFSQPIRGVLRNFDWGNVWEYAARKALLGGLPEGVNLGYGGRSGGTGGFVTTRQNRVDEVVPFREK